MSSQCCRLPFLVAGVLQQLPWIALANSRPGSNPSATWCSRLPGRQSRFAGSCKFSLHSIAEHWPAPSLHFATMSSARQFFEHASPSPVLFWSASSRRDASGNQHGTLSFQLPATFDEGNNTFIIPGNAVSEGTNSDCRALTLGQAQRLCHPCRPPNWLQPSVTRSEKRQTMKRKLPLRRPRLDMPPVVFQRTIGRRYRFTIPPRSREAGVGGGPRRDSQECGNVPASRLVEVGAAPSIVDSGGRYRLQSRLAARPEF
jgi:hypothetical protein